MKRLSLLILVVAAILPAIFSGCGYSTRSSAYEKSTKIYIKPFENKVDLNIENEISDQNPYRLYRPGMETKITDAVIERFMTDGYIKVVSNKDQADLILSGELMNYEKQPLRYDDDQNIEEYRANIIVNLVLTDVNKEKQVWEEKGFVGYSEFALIGPKAKSEDTAINDAVKDLSQRIVERTIEDW